MRPHEKQADEITQQFGGELKSHINNVKRVSTRLLRDGGNSAELAKRAGEMFDNVSIKLYEKYGEHIDCKEGCAHCCCVEVQVHQQEVDLLLQELRKNLDCSELSALKDKSQKVLDERKDGKRPRCALLGADERCTVYSIRPISCRACNSPDVNECKAYEQHGDETPRKVFALPMIFADSTKFAVNLAMYPSMTRLEYPQPLELMEQLLKSL